MNECRHAGKRTRTSLIICPRVKVLLIEVEVVVQCEAAHPALVGMGLYRVRVHPSYLK